MKKFFILAFLILIMLDMVGCTINNVGDESGIKKTTVIDESESFDEDEGNPPIINYKLENEDAYINVVPAK